MSDTRLRYVSGGLTILPELGEVRSAGGGSVRLGPVNMRVLELLLRCRGELVSRAELFDSVWTNQSVSDDTLTRAISDIRAELKRLTGSENHIETIPKRGYRWPEPVDIESVPESVPPAVTAGAPKHGEKPGPALSARLLRFTATGLGYLLAVLILASAAVWLLERFAGPAIPIVAVLPTGSTIADSEIAVALEDRLIESLLALDAVAVLSRGAVDSGPVNPFPYFYFEFDARWLVESELRPSADGRFFGLSLVDARTGIVLFEAGERLQWSTTGIPEEAVDAALKPLIENISDRLGTR